MLRTLKNAWNFQEGTLDPGEFLAKVPLWVSCAKEGREREAENEGDGANETGDTEEADEETRGEKKRQLSELPWILEFYGRAVRP